MLGSAIGTSRRKIKPIAWSVRLDLFEQSAKVRQSNNEEAANEFKRRPEDLYLGNF
jgi:hypothetical protein